MAKIAIDYDEKNRNQFTTDSPKKLLKPIIVTKIPSNTAKIGIDHKT